ncbi:MAG: M3 family oligoendopeptidase [Candidatus Altiarchaeota archaeon]
MAIWKLDDLYGDLGEKAIKERLRRKSDAFKAVRKTLDSKPSGGEFTRILEDLEEIDVLAGRVSAYANLRLSEDTADSERTAHEAMISQLIADVGNDTMFFGLWFRDLGDADAERYLAVSGKHRYPLQRIRAFKKHTLKESEEMIINLKDLTGSESAVRLYDMLTGRYRFMFEGRKLSYDEISHYKLSPKRGQRVEAYGATLRQYAADGAILGEIYRPVLNDSRNEDVKLRHFDSPLAAVNLGNDVPDAAVDNLLESVRKNRRLFQGYFRLKAKVTGIRRMDRYDLYVPHRDRERRYPYTDSMRTTLQVFRGFSEDAYLMAKRVFDEGHVHSELTRNKQPGAFCHTVVRGMTPYLMLNHVGKTEDLFTMVHETGHAVHSMAAAGQTESTYRPALPLAETASIFAEMLLTEKLLAEAEDSERASIMVRSLDRQYATIIRQAYFAIFERTAHGLVEGGASVEGLDAAYMKNLREQFGSSMSVPEIFRHEWKGIQHIFYSPFYCYTYALANLVVLALYRQYRTEGESFVPKYMRILSMGGSKSPRSILEEAGLDITKDGFWQMGFDAIREELMQLKRII